MWKVEKHIQTLNHHFTIGFNTRRVVPSCSNGWAEVSRILGVIVGPAVPVV